MKPEHLHMLRSDMHDLAIALGEARSLLAARRAQNIEVKYEPNQPRAGRGTTTGGQWVSSSASTTPSTRKPPSPPPPRRAAQPPQTLGNMSRAALRTPLPVIAGSVAISRAAGTFAAEVSGQAKTPFLHVPYSLPAIGSAGSRPRTQLGRPQRRPSQRKTTSENVDRQCEAQLDFDLGQCSVNAARHGREEQDRRAIYKICKRTAAERHAECRVGGGIGAIRTPLYRGQNYRGD